MDLNKFIFELEKLNINESIEDKGILKGCFMAGTPGCFDGDTLVYTKDGYKKIKNVMENDMVLTFNEYTKEDEWNYVKEKFIYKPEKTMLEIEFENGQKVICTEDHKFYINGEWVEAKDL